MKFRAWGMIAAAAAVALASFAPAASASEARPGWCARSSEPLVASRAGLFDALARKAERREGITIVAIGSSSTEGSDLPDRRQAYPTHLQAALSSLLRDAPVTVFNRGRGGEIIPETVERFEDDVARLKPDLVVWQLGGNDILRNADVEQTTASIEQGMAKLRSVGVPIVLMDTQSAPRVMQSPAREPIDKAIRRAAIRHGAVVWSRYELMTGILDAGRAKVDDLIRADGVHMTVPMHVCTGMALAEALAEAMHRGEMTARR